MEPPIDGADYLIRTVDRFDEATGNKERQYHYGCGCVFIFKVTEETPEFRREEKLDNLLCPGHVREYEMAESGQ